MGPAGGVWQRHHQEEKCCAAALLGDSHARPALRVRPPGLGFVPSPAVC